MLSDLDIHNMIAELRRRGLLVPGVQRGGGIAHRETRKRGQRGPQGPPGPTGPAALTCLDMFLVGPNPATAPYQSIQAALDAAAGMGFGPGNPADVLVCPGLYAENVAMTVADIAVKSVVGNSQQAPNVVSAPGVTRLLGQLTIDLASAGSRNATTTRWEGIDILPAAGNGVLFGGPTNAASYVYLADCRVISPDAEAVLITNTGTDGSLGSVLDTQRVTSESQGSPLVGAVGIAGAAFPFASFIGKNASILNLNGRGFVTTNGIVGLDSCIVSAGNGGAVAVGSAYRADDTIWQVTPNPLIDLDASSFARLLDNKVTADPTAPLVTGTGLFLHDGISFLGSNVPPVAPTLTVVTDQGLPQESECILVALPDAGAYTLTTETNILGECSTPAGAATILLPPGGMRPGPIRLKLGPNNAGAVTISGNGSPIRLAGAAPAPTVALTDPGFVLVYDPNNGQYEGWT